MTDVGGEGVSEGMRDENGNRGESLKRILYLILILLPCFDHFSNNKTFSIISKLNFAKIFEIVLAAG